MHFGVSTLAGCPLYCLSCDLSSCPEGPAPSPALDEAGRPIYVVTSSGASFKLVIEARPQGAPIDSELVPVTTTERPGLQVLSRNRLGPSLPPPEPVDCRSNLPSEEWGGIPGIEPLDYAASQPVTDALTDFACRFEVHTDPAFSCTLDVRGNSTFRNPDGASGGTVQFCHRVGSKTFFPSGVDTILSARARDQDGFLGAPVEIVVRVRP